MIARSVCAIALAGLCAAAPLRATADPYHAVYDGAVTDGFDTDGLFGLAGRSLAGLAIRADVTFLTSVPGTRTTDAVSDEVTGGEAFGTRPVISSATFTIAGKSAGFAPSYYGDVYTSADFLDAYGYDILGNSFQTFILPDVPGPRNLQTFFSSTGVGDAGGGSSQYSYAILGNDIIDFDALRVTVVAVPEPAAWALMLVGIGAIGAAMRRRRGDRTAALG